MHLNSDSWKRLVFYGEVIGFALAWIVGAVVLVHHNTPEPKLASTDGLAHAEVGLSDLPAERFK